MTFHGTSFATSYVSGAFSGDVTANDNGNGFGFPLLSWFFLEGVDVAGGPATSSVVAFGDSITDGFFTNIDSNSRWPDMLAKKLGPEFGVANAGIGGNSISTARNERNDPFAGPPGVDRWQRDALDQAGVRTIILLEGTNDLSIDAGAEPIEEAMRDVTARAHARGLCVIGATITPRSDGMFPYSWDAPRNEPERQKLNEWIRSPQAPFDAVADTDVALRWADHPQQLDPRYDFGDRVHLNARGRQAITDAMPLDVIRRCAQASAPPPQCTRRQRVTVKLPPGLRQIRVRAGKRVLRFAPGTRRVVLDVGNRTGEQLVVRVRARRGSGERFRATKRFTLCLR
jgi:lysophospholipase L1-like esterase